MNEKKRKEIQERLIANKDKKLSKDDKLLILRDRIEYAKKKGTHKKTIDRLESSLAKLLNED